MRILTPFLVLAARCQLEADFEEEVRQRLGNGGKKISQGMSRANAWRFVHLEVYPDSCGPSLAASG
jgi:hypothetical protein